MHHLGHLQTAAANPTYHFPRGPAPARDRSGGRVTRHNTSVFRRGTSQSVSNVELLSVHHVTNGSAAMVVLQYIDVDPIRDTHSGSPALPPTSWGECDRLNSSSSPGPGGWEDLKTVESKRRLEWLGHLVHMPNYRLPKIVFFWLAPSTSAPRWTQEEVERCGAEGLERHQSE